MRQPVPAWYRLLLRLAFPRAFRAELGDELLRVIGEQRRNLTQGSMAARALFHWSASVDLVRAGLRERRIGVRMLRIGGFTLFAAAVGHVAYDLATPELSMGYLAWGVTLDVGLLGVMLGVAPCTVASRR